MALGATVPDLPSFFKLIAAAREGMELSAAPLKYRQRIVSELRNIEEICGLPQPEMKTVMPLVRRLIMVMNEFDPSTADGLREWANKNHTG
jgi:hypothetical protein